MNNLCTLNEIFNKDKREIEDILLENNVPLGSNTRNIINVMHILSNKLSKEERRILNY